MNLVVASPTGLCYGVRRAIDQLECALGEHGVVYSLGSPIHNPQEVERLTRKGLRVVERAAEVPLGEAAFVRAHGIAPDELAELNRRTNVITDGTCGHVRAAQQWAESLSSEGYPVVIFGDAAHPEVRGIRGFVQGEVLIYSSCSDIGADANFVRLGVLSQTTQEEASFASIVARLVLLSREVKVYNTICRATIERQESIRRLAAQVDGIVVIGGRNSANTRKLAQIAESLGVPTLWIEHAGEFEGSWLQGKGTIGVAAGGSTPDWLINELTGKLMRL